MQRYYFTGSPGTGPVLGNQNNGGKGGGFDDALGKAGTVLDTVNKVLCTVNPKRPGCQISETTIIQEQRRNTWMIVALMAVIVVMLIVLIRRKK